MVPTRYLNLAHAHVHLCSFKYPTYEICRYNTKYAVLCYWSVYQLFINAEIKGCPLVRIISNGMYIYIHRIYDKQLILPVHGY